MMKVSLEYCNNESSVGYKLIGLKGDFEKHLDGFIFIPFNDQFSGIFSSRIVEMINLKDTHIIIDTTNTKYVFQLL